MYSIVAADTLRKGGLDLDDAIVSYVRRKYGVVIGQLTAEQLKFKMCRRAAGYENTGSQGQDQVWAAAGPLTLRDRRGSGTLSRVAETCRQYGRTHPELVADIIDRGVCGRALLRGIDKLLTKSLGIPAYLVDNPMTCVVEGAVRGLGMMNILRRNLPQV
jgi:rod shape-determining protein MreB